MKQIENKKSSLKYSKQSNYDVSISTEELLPLRQEEAKVTYEYQRLPQLLL